MDTLFSLTEVTGYLASALVLISFLMKNIRTLRIVNSLGCLLFLIYGLMLQYSWPIIITNGVIILINLYYLRQYQAVRDHPSSS